jgi:hypothetical protein
MTSIALLGHTARIIISVTSMSESTAAWEAAGFEIESQKAGFTRLTDGQVLVSLIEQDFSSPALAYFHVDHVRLATELAGRGLTTREANETGFVVEGPGGVDIHIHQRPIDQKAEPTGEQNPLFGYFDALVTGAEDPFIERRKAEEMGFFVQEEFVGDFPQSDVTDGLVNLSIRTKVKTPFLVYRTDVTKELVMELQESFTERCRVTVNKDGTVAMVTLTMPEGTRIMITNDDAGDEE